MNTVSNWRPKTPEKMKLRGVRFVIAIISCLTFSQAVADETTTQGRVYDIGTYVTDLEVSEEFYTTVFGFEVVRRWKEMEVSTDGKNYKTVPTNGIYLRGSNGMHLEFIQKDGKDGRQVIQEPINHFAIHVDDVEKTYKDALKSGAKPVFERNPIMYLKIGEFSVINTQIIGPDGERIQILKVLKK